MVVIVVVVVVVIVIVVVLVVVGNVIVGVVVLVVVVVVVIESFNHFSSSFSYRSFYSSTHQLEGYDVDGDVLHFFSW